MRGFALVVATLAGFAFAGTAFADPAFPTGFSATSNVTTDAPGSNFVSTPGGAHLSANDGTTATFTYNSGGYVGALPVVTNLVLTLNFNAGEVGGDLDAVIFDYKANVSTGAGTPSVAVDRIRWSHGANFNEWDIANRTLGSDLVNPTSTKFEWEDFGAATTSGGTFDRFQANTLIITFAVTTNLGGEQFEFDAISNPEPGTMALFGLGALGLGAVAWRRRKAKLAKSA